MEDLPFTRSDLVEYIRAENERIKNTPYSYTCHGKYNFRYETFDREEFDSFVREFKAIRRHDAAADAWRAIVRVVHPVLWALFFGTMIFGAAHTVVFSLILAIVVCFMVMLFNLPTR